MKTAKIFWLIPILLLLSSCTPEEIPIEHDLSAEEKAIKNKLIGLWYELSPCDSCLYYRFTEEDSLIESSTEIDLIFRGNFRIISIDSIEVIRPYAIAKWYERNTCKIQFVTNDILIVENLFPVDYDTHFDGFVDVKLKRIN